MIYRTSWVNGAEAIRTKARSGAIILMTAEREFRSAIRVLPVPG